MVNHWLTDTMFAVVYTRHSWYKLIIFGYKFCANIAIRNLHEVEKNKNKKIYMYIICGLIPNTIIFIGFTHIIY